MEKQRRMLIGIKERNKEKGKKRDKAHAYTHDTFVDERERDVSDCDTCGYEREKK